MQKNINSEFYGKINGIEFNNEEVYKSTDYLLNALETEKKIEINDPNFTKQLKSEIENLQTSVEQFSFSEMEAATINSISTEKTLTDFTLRANDYDNGFEYSHLAKDFNERLQRGEFETAIKGNEKDEALLAHQYQQALDGKLLQNVLNGHSNWQAFSDGYASSTSLVQDIQETYQALKDAKNKAIEAKDKIVETSEKILLKYKKAKAMVSTIGLPATTAAISYEMYRDYKDTVPTNQKELDKEIIGRFVDQLTEHPETMKDVQQTLEKNEVMFNQWKEATYNMQQEGLLSDKSIHAVNSFNSTIEKNINQNKEIMNMASYFLDRHHNK